MTEAASLDKPNGSSAGKPLEAAEVRELLSSQYGPVEPSVGPSVGALAGVAAVALVAALLAGLMQGDRLRWLVHAYLTNYCFIATIVLGSLCFVVLQHATSAGWSVVCRRAAELVAGNTALLAALYVPLAVFVVLGGGELYPWADPHHVAGSALLQHKAAYLNVPFFLARTAGYLALWWVLAQVFVGRSLRQDRCRDPQLTLTMQRWAGPALVALGLSATFAAVDWLMSLAPEWFSTIFGLYYIAGGFVAGVAAWILVLAGLQRAGRLAGVVTAEHYHDLGKLLFAFVFFWGYIAFSQYLLIWYGNVPEETVWYRPRLSGFWGGAAVALLFGHLTVPFLALLPREVKRRKNLLVFWAVWLLAFHWLDLAWLVMPQAGPGGLLGAVVQVSLAVAMLCVLLAGTLHKARRWPVVPVGDPRLAESIAFENQ